MNKKSRSEYREFWQPVGYFQVENQVQIDLDYKRSSRYIFILPTQNKVDIKKKDEVYAVKIDFIGIKGRIEQERVTKTSLYNYKDDGSTECQLGLTH